MDLCNPVATRRVENKPELLKMALRLNNALFMCK